MLPTARHAPRTARRRAAVRPTFVMALALGSLAQSGASRAAAPRDRAIVGARIVAAPDQVIPRGNIVMRDGIIVAVGAHARKP